MSATLNQRTIYKLVDALLATKVEDPISMLSELVRYLVDNSRMVMTGGQVWELEPTSDRYILRYEYGDVDELGESPTDTASFTGVGELETRDQGPLPPYGLAFTTYERSDEFKETMMVVAAAATTALRNKDTAQRDKEMMRDLDQAWQIQHGLVPDHHVQFREYDIFGISLPEKIVGGDYFDYVRVPDEEDRLGIVISDAASKGLPAAAQALFVSGALRMGVSFQTKMSALVSRLNQLIYDTFPLERFVSLFYCEIMSSASGLVLYVNAGHCPPLLRRAEDGGRRTLEPTGGILGIVEDQSFTVENVNMGPGDVLVLYTDGITEAQNGHAELYGEDRLWDIIDQHAHGTAEDISQAILDSVMTFSEDANYSDDKTLVVIKRNKPPTT